jgi:hypothetical protein
MNTKTINEELVNNSNQPHGNKSNEVNNKLNLETMSTETKNEELVNNSNQPQIKELYKMLNENKVLNLKDVMNYDWIREIDSKEEMYNKITDNGKFVIWELPDKESTIDMMFSYTDIESKIDEIISENENNSEDEIFDSVIDEYHDRVEDYFEKQLVHSIRNIDINNISNYLVSKEEINDSEDYYNCLYDIQFYFIDRIKSLVNTWSL